MIGQNDSIKPPQNYYSPLTDVFLFLGHFGLSHLVAGRRQPGAPTQPYPLLDIVGQSGPQNFQPHFNQSAQPKLSKSQFVFNPRVGKFRNRSPLSVNSLPRLGLHFVRKLLHCWRAFGSDH